MKAFFVKSDTGWIWFQYASNIEVREFGVLLKKILERQEVELEKTLNKGKDLITPVVDIN